MPMASFMLQAKVSSLYPEIKEKTIAHLRKTIENKIQASGRMPSEYDYKIQEEMSMPGVLAISLLAKPKSIYGTEIKFTTWKPVAIWDDGLDISLKSSSTETAKPNFSAIFDTKSDRVKLVVWLNGETLFKSIVSAVEIMNNPNTLKEISEAFLTDLPTKTKGDIDDETN